MILTLIIILTAQFSNISSEEALKLYLKTLEYIDKYQKKDSASILNSIDALLKKEDKYAELMYPENYKEFQDKFSGHEIGLGIVIDIFEENFVVVSVIPNSPADKNNIPIGAIIEKIGDTILDTSEQNIPQIYKLLSVKLNEEKEISYFFKNSFRVVKLKGSVIQKYGFKYDKLDEGIGLLKIDIFQEKISIHIEEKILKENLKFLIIDIRDNPGGYVEEAVKLTDLFINKGIIVSYKEKNRKNFIYNATEHTPFKDIFLILLINEESASASEIFAGALKDHNRAVLIGKKTYGKGSIQTIIPLEHNFAVKLTTALYYTPNNTKIDKNGIIPHIIVPRYINTKEKYKEIIFKQILEGRYKNDHQFYTALNLLKNWSPVFRHNTNTKKIP